MDLNWTITNDDISEIQEFVTTQADNAFVRQRIQTNLGPECPRFSREEFWKEVISCLLTTQQRSGPDSAVARFIRQQPFPLSYDNCRKATNLSQYVSDLLRDFGGIRRFDRIAGEAYENLESLEHLRWIEIERLVEELRADRSKSKERSSAVTITEFLAGFGPKQSRNLLQGLGLTRYEIPLDSRIIRWFNQFGFPLKLTSKPLSDEAYYCFVLDGIQSLCEQAKVFPCVFDASIFASFD